MPKVRGCSPYFEVPKESLEAVKTARLSFHMHLLSCHCIMALREMYAHVFRRSHIPIDRRWNEVCCSLPESIDRFPDSIHRLSIRLSKTLVNYDDQEYLLARLSLCPLSHRRRGTTIKTLWSQAPNVVRTPLNFVTGEDLIRRVYKVTMTQCRSRCM